MKPDLPFQAAIFDMDGLLLDTEQLAWDAFQTVCSKLQLPDVSSVFYQCIGANSNANKVILKNGLEGITDYMDFRERWDSEYTRLTHEQELPLKDGVLDILKLFRSMSMPTAVATSTKTERALSKLEYSGIRQYFQFVIGGDQVERSKPEPDIYLAAAASLKVDPQDCIAFEDSPNGVRAAVAAGMTVVQIPDLVEPTHELRQLGHIVLDSLIKVPHFYFSTRA